MGDAMHPNFESTKKNSTREYGSHWYRGVGYPCLFKVQRRHVSGFTLRNRDRCASLRTFRRPCVHLPKRQGTGT
eukprot:SAG31_NODE_2482_length_5634_cov_1.887805_4_plen_74_part_00